MTTRIAQTNVGKVKSNRLIGSLVQADRSPAQLAQELGLTLRQLAKWAADSDNTSVLRHLAALADIRAQMLLSHCRANVAARLVEIAMDKQPTELARKACVDVLRANLAPMQ